MTPHTAKAEFSNAAKTNKPKRIAPLSVRVSKEQRAELEKRAVGMSLNAYVLACLFENKSKKRKRRSPTKRDKALASVLRRLGHSGIVAYLTSQIVAVEEGRLHLSNSEEKELRDAHTELFRIRADLVSALGLEGDV